jgi:DNA-binding NarL/FixJ family response regulator
MLVDDHAIVRDGIRASVEQAGEFVVVGEASSFSDFQRLIATQTADIVVTDIILPDGAGWDVIELARRSTASAVVVLSMLSDEASISQAMRMGALGYVAKELEMGYLIEAVRAAADGRRYVGPNLMVRMNDRLAVSSLGGRAPYLDLTVRERDVFHLLVQGLSSPEVAANLAISRRTVEIHRARVMRKLGCRTQADLFRYALGWRSL